MPQDDMLKEFVAEAEEIIEGLNQNLLQMEAADDKANIRPDILNSIFRAAHTLKGMSGMVGLQKVSEISHRLEDMLDKLRMGKLSVSEALMDTLFLGLEKIRELVVEADSGKGENADIKPLLEKIDQIESGGGGETGTDEIEGVSPDIIKVLTEYETHRLKENIRLGLNLFEVHSAFKLETFDQDLANLTAAIQNVGEVITTLPSPGDTPDAGIVFDLIVGTKTGLDEVVELLKSENVTIKRIGSSGQAPPPPPVEIQEAPPKAAAGSAVEPEASIRSITPTVRVDIGKLDSLLNVVGELVLSKAIIGQIAREMLQSQGFGQEVMGLQKAYQALDRRVGELQEGLIEIRMLPVGQVFDRLVRVVRKLSKELGKEVDLQISGEETKMDKSMIEEIADPLMHLIRNSLDHGLETREEREAVGKNPVGKINLRAAQQGNNVVIEIEDDGKGIDVEKIRQKGVEKGLLEAEKTYEKQELLNVMFTPGFSTAEKITEISGRGVGLDVVAKNISNLSGLVNIKTEKEKGTKFSISLPITLIIIKALVVGVGENTYAIPLNSVSESLMVDKKDIRTIEKKEVIQLRDQTLSIIRIRDLFDLESEEPKDSRVYVIVVGLAEKRLGLIVDSVEGQQEIVTKSLGEYLRATPGIAGAAELGNRKTILVLDVGALIDQVTQKRKGEAGDTPSPPV